MRKAAVVVILLGISGVLFWARNDKKSPVYDVIIVGAGISGLTAGALLAEEEYNLLVLEKNEYAGGRANNGEHNGFYYARGTEYLGKPRGELASLIRKLKVKPVEIPSPTDTIWYNNKFYYGEEGIALMYIENSSLKEYNSFISMIKKYASKYEHVPDFDLNSPLAKLDGISVKDFFKSENVPSIFFETYNTSSRGLFGASIEDISALSFIPEIYFDYYDSPLIKDAADLTNSFPGKGTEKTGTYSFTYGISEVTKAIASYLGERIRYNSYVTSVTRDKKGYYKVEYVHNNKKEYLYSETVILAVPAPVVLSIAEKSLDGERKELLEKIPYATYVTLALYLKEQVFTGAFDLALPGNPFITDIYDATWVQRYYDKSVTNRKDSVLTAYIAPLSYEDRSNFLTGDREILKRTKKELEKIFPGISKKITGYDIFRFPHAYPVMTKGAYKRLTGLNLLNEGSLILAGDYMSYPTFEAACESGALAAEKIIEYNEL